MRSILWLFDTVVTLYVYVLIASAILSWLVAFNVVNERNPIVAQIGDFLYRVTEPVLIQHGYVEARGEQLANFTEISSVNTDVALEQTLTYSVTAYVSTVDEQSLRASGVSYPDWVQSAYLQLPETLPGPARRRPQPAGGTVSSARRREAVPEEVVRPAGHAAR